MSIASVIYNQIRTLDVWALGAWGARDFVNMGDGLKFKTSGMVRWKGYVYVKLDEASDLYDVIFGRVRKSEWKEDLVVKGVFSEDLIHVINEKVG